MDGFLVMYDVTDPSSFAAVQGWFSELDRWAGEEARASVILVGNKCDKEERRVSQDVRLSVCLSVSYSICLYFIINSAFVFVV